MQKPVLFVMKKEVDASDAQDEVTKIHLGPR